MLGFTEKPTGSTWLSFIGRVVSGKISITLFFAFVVYLWEVTSNVRLS